MLLVQNRGRALIKDELMSSLWPGIVVEEANLTQAIFTLRKLLGDSPKDHRYIATLPGRGYQFVAAVSESQIVNDTAPIAPFASSTGHSARNLLRIHHSRSFWIVTLLVVAISGFVARRVIGTRRIEEADSTTQVVPFTNLLIHPSSRPMGTT